MTPAIRRPAAAALVGAAVVVLTAGCVFTPPGLPATPTESVAVPAPDGPAPTESTEAAETEEPTETAAAEGRYEITAEGQDDSVWSFEVTDSRVVDADSNGKPADPGFQLVEVLIDAEVLEGEPDFYTAFHVYIVDDATGDEYGLSTGSAFYAENDLYAAGRAPSFTDGVGIFHVPGGIGIDHVRITTDQGGSWDFTR
ncbi:MAG: hypothetical protein ACQEWM_00180 [Actinomycetota bacterium]